jgi:hypothetical protein
MAIHLDRQRPPKKRMGRKQRLGSKSNPSTRVQWANWLDNPAGRPGGGGGLDPGIAAVTPSSVAASAAATLITVTGSDFQSGAVIEFDNVAVPTTFVNSGTLTTSFDPTVAKVIQVTVRQGVEESNNLTLTVTATTADPTSSWTKAEIVEWLRNQGVDMDPGAEGQFTKAELLDIVAAYLNGDPVDDLLGG